MKKIAILAAAVGLAFAACGDDERVDGHGGAGGADGTGGSGGGRPPRGTVAIENGEGRSFFGGPAQIVVKEPERVSAPALTSILVQGREDTDGDGVGDGDAYDLQLVTTGSLLLTGEVASGAVQGSAPKDPGEAKVDTFDENGDLVWGGAADSIVFAISGGGIEGEVKSAKPAIASTISGMYELRCEILEGTEHVRDTDFTSSFCEPYRALLPTE